MSSSGVSLLQMPEIPMKHILEYLDFSSILALRKVCHDLRNFIDDTKPASRLTKIDVNVYPKYNELCLESRAQNKICIYYEKCNEGCLVSFKKYHENEILKRLDNEDFVNVFCKDVDIILSHQKTVLEHFGIYLASNSTIKERVLEDVNQSFKSMNHPLQVKSLSMIVSDHDDVLSILPYMVPKLLELIHIGVPKLKNNLLNLDEVEKLEQWKQAKKLSIDGFEISVLAQYLKHFLSINLNYRDISIEELVLLKEIFLSSSILTAMEIHTFHSSADIRPSEIETFGQPFLGNNQDFLFDRDPKWFFRIPDTVQFLRIRHESSKIDFDRIEQSDVPQNANISN